jgi:membrane fusion protein (multidrug efflux system)
LLRSLIAILVVLLVGAGAAGAYWQFVMVPGGQAATAAIGGRGANRGPVPVEAAEVKVAPAEVTTEAVGTLSSNESVLLKPEVAGRIASINFEEGRPVKAGQVMIELDALVEKAQLIEAQAQLELATANLERARELRRSNAGTQRALDEAQAQQRTATASVDLAKARLAKLTLLAPFDAVAGLRRVSVGEFVTAGDELVNLEQIQPLKVDFRIPEVFLPSLFDVGGQKRILVVVDAIPEEQFSGRVYAVNPLVDEQGRAIVVRAQIDNPLDAKSGEPRLRPGLFARVTLTLSEQDEALWVPEETLVPQGSRQFVFKVMAGADGAQTVKFTEVTLGRRRQGEVQIVSGLARGDVVVTAGVSKIRDNAAVTVQVPPPETPPAAPSTASGSLPAGQPAQGDRPTTSRG